MLSDKILAASSAENRFNLKKNLKRKKLNERVKVDARCLFPAGKLRYAGLIRQASGAGTPSKHFIPINSTAMMTGYFRTLTH